MPPFLPEVEKPVPDRLNTKLLATERPEREKLQTNSANGSSVAGPYEALKENEIRLAEIAPASAEDEEIICRLQHVSLNHLPHYKALSYAWGDIANLGQISVNGNKSFYVTRTLETALRQLRRNDDKPLLIWIDALCIDQDNNVEKGEQVQKMRLIYKRAEEVYIWLGPHCDTSPHAWKLAKNIAKCYGDRSATSRAIGDATSSDFDALKALFRRGYWFRIWVVQEVACAQKKTVYCGSDSISWSGLLAVCDTMTHIRYDIYHIDPTSMFSLMRGGPRKLTLTEPSLNLIFESNRADKPQIQDLLYTHGSKLSSNPLDKVYGLIGISSDRDSFGKIDYERSVRSTYIHTAQHIISTSKLLNVICFNQNDDNKYGLPSWAPDWERRLEFPQHRVMGLHVRLPAFKASGSLLSDTSFSPNGDILSAVGLIIDTVAELGQKFYVDGPEGEFVIPTLKTFYNWWRIFVDHSSVPLDSEVFQRTFCGGSWAPDYEEHESKRLPYLFSLLYKLCIEVVEDGCPSRSLLSMETETSDTDLEKRQYAMAASTSLRMHAKRLVISASKRVGFAPQATLKGDTIAVLRGCAFPVVLRKEGPYWRLIGEVYVDGIMYGEAVNSGSSFDQAFHIC